jgi:hypothetical protein
VAIAGTRIAQRGEPRYLVEAGVGRVEIALSGPDRPPTTFGVPRSGQSGCSGRSD